MEDLPKLIKDIIKGKYTLWQDNISTVHACTTEKGVRHIFMKERERVLILFIDI